MLILLCFACDGSAGPACDLPLLFEKSPGDALEGSGWHRVYVQGSSSIPQPSGRFDMNEYRNRIDSGDHFLLSPGALVEWTYPVVGILSGKVLLHLARVDDPDVLARYELFFVHNNTEIEMFRVDDASNGQMGYIPFERCFFADGVDMTPAVGDHLLLRVINLSSGMLGVVIRSPDYFTWIDIEVL